MTTAKAKKSPKTGTGPEPTVALVLGGGGARGLAHAHVIEAFDELGIRPKIIAGSSIGAIMGSAMAAGMPGKDVRLYVEKTFGNRTEVMSRIWKLRPRSISDVMQGGFGFTRFNIVKMLKSFLPADIPDTFEDLQIPLLVTATDFYGQSLVTIDSGDLFSAIGASAAIPGVFMPVRRDNVILVDGGIYNPVPFDLVAGMADIVLAVDVVGGPEGDPGTVPSAIDAAFGASQLMQQSIIATKLTNSRPDILLRPPVARYRVLDFLRAKTIISGTSGLKDETMRALDAAMAFCRKNGSP